MIGVGAAALGSLLRRPALHRRTHQLPSFHLQRKTVSNTLVLTVDSLWASKAGIPDAGSEIPLWLTLTVLGLVGAGLLYGNMREKVAV